MALKTQGRLNGSDYAGLQGSVHYCASCEEPKVHLAAQGGVPTCAFCGATPATSAPPSAQATSDVRPYEPSAQEP